jgi:hypothetical protein
MSLAILVADGVEHIECLRRTADRDHHVAHATGDQIEIAGCKFLHFVANMKQGPAGHDQTHLLVHVRMPFDDAIGGNIDKRKLQMFAGVGARRNVAEKNVMPAFNGGREVAAHADSSRVCGEECMERRWISTEPRTRPRRRSRPRGGADRCRSRSVANSYLPFSPSFLRNECSTDMYRKRPMSGVERVSPIGAAAPTTHSTSSN